MGPSSIERRRFVAGTLGSLVAPGAVAAQPAAKVHRVAVLVSGSPADDLQGAEPRSPLMSAFLGRLRDLGHVYGRNVLLDVRSGHGNVERLPDLAAELVQLKPDVIMTTAAAARAVMNATTTIPIVISGIPDPVLRGVVGSLSRPEGNVTGVSSDAGPDIDGKRIELLKETVPRVSRVACIALESWWDSPWGKSARASADARGVTLLPVEAAGPDRIDEAFAAIARQAANGLFVRPTSTTVTHRARVIELAAKHRLPAMYLLREFAEAGGLMVYGVRLVDLYRRAADYVSRILKGARPADLPIERPTKFELVVNLRTARALGVKVPSSVLLRTDEVID